MSPKKQGKRWSIEDANKARPSKDFELVKKSRESLKDSNSNVG